MAYSTTQRRQVLVAAGVVQSSHSSGIVRYARAHDWHVLSDTLLTAGFPNGCGCDGVLAVTGHQTELVEHVRRSGLPWVLISRSDHVTHCPRVEEHHVEIGRVAADHFLDRAYRSFAWAPLRNDKPNLDRLRGFQTRLAEYNCQCHVLPEAHLWNGSHWDCNWTEYRRRLTAHFLQLPRPTAIFAFNDGIAANLIAAAGDCGISVPEEFAILGVGNDPLVCESAPVPLSSVELDHDQMGYRAAEVLDGLMNGAVAPEDAILVSPKGIVTRVSTDLTAVADIRIARALAFIAENYPNPMLSVIDVADAVGISRRNLERGFRKITGVTVRDHVVRTRMQEASRLLTACTRAKTSEIARLVGMAATGNFFRTFRRFYGMSPQAYRAMGIAEGRTRIESPLVNGHVAQDESVVAAAV